MDHERRMSHQCNATAKRPDEILGIYSTVQKFGRLSGVTSGKAWPRDDEFQLKLMQLTNCFKGEFSLGVQH